MRAPAFVPAFVRYGLSAVLASAAAAAPAAPVRDAFELAVTQAPAAVPVDGGIQLVYELHLTNFAAMPLRPLRLDVIDGHGALLARIDAKALRQRLAPIGVTDDGTQAIQPGRRAVVYLELPLPAGATPQRLSHRLAYALPGGEACTVEGAPTQPGRAPSVLGPPLRGGPWVAIHEPSWPRGHRRVFHATDGAAVVPGRFAIDFVRVDGRGRIARGDADRVRAHLGYGAEVLAVADAVVHAVRDNMGESDRLSTHPEHPLGDATGNYVALELGDGRFAFYEHLKPGSVRVKPGQRVRRGDTLAALGNTGESTGPHLHLHVGEAGTPLAEGAPFVFDRFRVLGRYADLGTLGSQRWSPPPAAHPAARAGERPAPNTVLLFP